MKTKEYCEKYEDLTIHQRISLKGFFETDKTCAPFQAVKILWNFKVAVNFFLTNDINLLGKK